jgi:hypothetical protein
MVFRRADLVLDSQILLAGKGGHGFMGSVQLLIAGGVEKAKR